MGLVLAFFDQLRAAATEEEGDGAAVEFLDRARANVLAARAVAKVEEQRMGGQGGLEFRGGRRAAEDLNW